MDGLYYHIKTEQQREQLIKMIASTPLGFDIKLEKAEKENRTLKQNSSLHQYFTMLAKALNDAGYDMKRTLKQDVEIPWNKDMVKEHLWRPIQKITTEKHSTAQAETDEYSKIYGILSRHLSQKTGVYVEWPSRR